MAEQKATTRPSRPTIDTVTDNVPPYTGVIEKGGLTNDPRPTVSGRGDPGATIHVLVDGVEVGTAVVGASGTWSFALTQPLHDGEYRLTARASNEVGLSVPSASYGIQLDTTPPSQPKIETATEGAQPTLSGRAEAYSTVTIYDGMTVLGTTTTNIDGTWTFQLPSGLSNGKHALTVSAMDPAGNTSVRSDGFDVTIGTVAPPVPTTKAILDEMGHDSGNFNFDRLTNDGTAGRLLSGHLTAALAAGEKVQVSTDGGRTWVDALMKSDGTWVVTDMNAHGGNWTIQTRVVNGNGVAGTTTTYDVELDTLSPDPVLTAVRSVNAIDVSFAGKNMVVGDAINVMIGDQRISYNLTAADIAAGRAKVTIPAGIAASMDEHTSYGVALVDRSGNISDYLVTRYEAHTSGGQGTGGIQYKTYDFNNETVRDLVPGAMPTDFGVFSLVLDAKSVYRGQGLRVAGGSPIGTGLKPPVGETGLLVDLAGAKFHLKGGAHAQALTLDLGLPMSNTRLFAIDFFDDAGSLVYRYFLGAYSSQIPTLLEIRAYHIVLPDNLEFASFGFSGTGGGPYSPGYAAGLGWIDNVGFAGGSFGPIAPSAEVNFNDQTPRDLVAGAMPTNFGIFSLGLSTKMTGQGIRLSGGAPLGSGIKPPVGETGLLVDLAGAKFYLNGGAHAQALTIDLGAPRSKATSFAIDFFDDAGNLVHRYFLEGYRGSQPPSELEIRTYHIVLPDNLQFASFGFSGTGGGEYFPAYAAGLAWIDNVGFSGGSFSKTTWETITELVPPADVQHVLTNADAEYFGSSHGTEFQLDNVSYFTNQHAGLHGGAGIDTLKLTGANQTLDISKLLNVGGHDKISSIEILDITGVGNNTLKLSMRDVLELGHENVFRNDGHTQLMVNGNAGDRVELSGMNGLGNGQWTNQGLVAINGQAYTLYENAALHVELLVQSAIATQLV
ncbi:Ig-like domain-containing protein [Burkholderia sp. BCC0419]|uniref:Ig-like domain-containing protein n=1 Tax=Burkholderia sp. BCC0419 TaxID=486878 RepID=UPI00158EC4EC|nr:Ig-like domain-containing protein [Burkholderia sp. BCC0419]